MKTLTAAEFKELLSTAHQAVNVNVTERIIYDSTDTSPLSGDILIKNCDLNFFFLSSREADSLTILGGKVNELRIDTAFRCSTIKLKSNIKTLSLVEMNCLSLEFIALDTPTVITGRGDFLGNTTWKGNIKSMNLLNPDAETVQILNFSAKKIELISPKISSFVFTNVAANNCTISYSPGDIPDDADFNFKNLDVKSLEILFRNRLIELKGVVKQFVLGSQE